VAALLVLAVVVALVQVNVLGFAFHRLGLSEGWTLAVLAATVLGGVVNIPVLRLHPDRPVRRVSWTPWGWLLTVESPRPTVVAVNLGGAVIPVALSAYLLGRTGILLDAVVGVAVVAVVAHRFSRVVPDLGVVLSPLVPVLAATAVTLLLQPVAAAALAYVSGTLGTLVGADLTNLRAVVRSAPPVIAIGGAGTFDGIVLAGVAAVVLVAVL
jgi:uncharacterized membrane protein